MDGRPLARIDNDATIYYYHVDHLGTPQAMTNAAGATVWKADYEPFGKVVVKVNTIENNLRFKGQYFDRETGLHYNYFRDYDPGTGRYVESDPIGLAGGLNLYLYANAAPTMYTDPLGLNPFGGGNTRSPGIPGPASDVFIRGTPANNIFVDSVYRIINAVKEMCQTNTCPSCTPYPMGTIGYIGPHTDHDHYPVGRPHLNLFVVNQSSNCKCFWNKANPDVASPPPAPGWVDLNSGFPVLSP